MNPEPAHVQGIHCQGGHFNHPRAQFCAQCGVSMVLRAHVAVQGPRPVLGVLVTDDGTLCPVGGDLVVGLAHGAAQDQVAPGRLGLADGRGGIAPDHAQLRLHDWDVYVIDLGSPAGTAVAARGSQQWTRLTAHFAHKIPTGTTIALGHRMVSFDSHHGG